MDSVIVELIKRRRNQLWVHSIIYYELNSNLIDDHTYDRWSQELVELQREYPEESREADHYKVFADWDGSTGAFLPLRDKTKMDKAERLLLAGRVGYVKTQTVPRRKTDQALFKTARKKNGEGIKRKGTTKLRRNSLW